MTPFSFAAALTDEEKILAYMLRPPFHADSAWMVARMTGLDPNYVSTTLARWADDLNDTDHPIIRRIDLGADCYEGVEDSARDADR